MTVLMLTSSEQPEDREEALGYSVVKDYVVKPLTPERMAELLETYG